MAGETFGRFTLLGQLAVGGMAEVYLARSSGAEGLDKYFALKRILPQLMKDKEFVEMFKTEAKIALNLTQSNIAQILEFGLEGDQFFLLMEFIDGRDLRQILSRCAELKDGFTIEQIVYMMSEVAAGLDYAHRCSDKKTGKPLKLIHRDISPQNLMVSFDGEIKIIDFGVAKIESKITTTRAGTVKGKLSYMSPEQALGEPLDSRTDIFSAGIILWELLTGRRLFENDDDMGTIKKIRECRISDPVLYNPRIPGDLQRIVMKALCRDRNYRYQSAKEFQRDLITFLHKVNPKFTPEDLAISLRAFFKNEIEEFRAKMAGNDDKDGLTPGATGGPQPTKSMVIQPTQDHYKNAGENPYFGEPTKSQSIKLSQPMVKINSPAEISSEIIPELRAEAPVGLKFTAAPPQPSVPDEKPVWDSKQLLQGVKIKVKTTTPINPSQPTQSQPDAQAPHTKDSTIMFRAVLAFLFVSLGIYFRTGIVSVAKDRGEAVRTIVVSFGEQMGVSRKTASVALHEDGSGENSSSKTATLQNAKIAIRVMPEASQIDLNGHGYGNAPADLLIPLNTHVTITIKHEGYSSFKQDFTVGGPKEINVTLQKQE